MSEKPKNAQPDEVRDLARRISAAEKEFEEVVKRVADGSREDFAAMTINERMLYVPGLDEKWIAAARARDRDAMIKVMKQVDYKGDTAQTVDIVLADPAKYGF